ncbi:MAG: hypothetical protein V1845_01265 [bacterium]
MSTNESSIRRLIKQVALCLRRACQSGKMNNMGKKINKFIYWTPRILSIIFILFLALMSLDVFSPELSFWQTLGALFIHNIPALVLLIVLLISWKHEIVGGIAFVLAGLLYIIILTRKPFEWYMLFWSIQISGVAFLIGILFVIGWFKKKKISGE